MDESERHRLIIDMLKERPFATVKDLLERAGLEVAEYWGNVTDETCADIAARHT